MSKLDVMLVEDEVGTLTALAAFLRMHGKRVGEAASLDAAFEILDATNPSCLVCDENLAGQSGLRVLERYLDQVPEGRAALCSANVHAAAQDFLERHGSVDLLSKPIAPKQLLQWVDRALSSKTVDLSPQQDRDVPLPGRIEALELDPALADRVQVALCAFPGGVIQSLRCEEHWVQAVIAEADLRELAPLPKGCEAWPMSDATQISLRIHRSAVPESVSARRLLWGEIEVAS